MLLKKRVYLGSLCFCVALAGCTPANYVQRIKLAPACEVRVCRDANTALQRCSCQSTQHVERQLREAGWLTEK